MDFGNIYILKDKLHFALSNYLPFALTPPKYVLLQLGFLQKRFELTPLSDLAISLDGNITHD